MCRSCSRALIPTIKKQWIPCRLDTLKPMSQTRSGSASANLGKVQSITPPCTVLQCLLPIACSLYLLGAMVL